MLLNIKLIAVVAVLATATTAKAQPQIFGTIQMFTDVDDEEFSLSHRYQEETSETLLIPHRETVSSRVDDNIVTYVYGESTTY